MQMLHLLPYQLLRILSTQSQSFVILETVIGIPVRNASLIERQF